MEAQQLSEGSVPTLPFFFFIITTVLFFFSRPLPKGVGASLRAYEAALIKLRFINFYLILSFLPFSFVIL